MDPLSIAAFDFELPESLIAQEPPAVRGDSRLLVLRRETAAVEHAMFPELPRFLRPGDLLVVNDTRVFPARLLGRRVPSGGAVECLLLERAATDAARAELPAAADPRVETWDALMHPGQKLKPGARVRFEADGVRLDGEVLERRFYGRRTVRLAVEQGTVAEAIDRLGHIPLPPYITRDDTPADRERYQTVFARDRGSIAAPTAGLHFTEPLLASLAAQGIETARVTLHVGYGTFKPVRVERVDEHTVDPERFTVSEATAEALTRAKREGRRIVAVGTTTTRALESLAVDGAGVVLPATGETRTFIRPGHRFRLVDALITNFHLPRSSLLLLVCALGGTDAVLRAYREAVARGYRFYSYGDAMLVG